MQIKWTCPVCNLSASVPEENANKMIRHKCSDIEKYLALFPDRSSMNGTCSISLVIATHNEGKQLLETIESAKKTTRNLQVIVVDDGSTDGSCDNLDAIVVRHKTRHGIAVSRSHGAAYATSKCLVFADGHQTFEEGCLNRIAGLSIERNAIVWPCLRGMKDSSWNGRHHGARIAVDDKGRPRREKMPGIGWVRSEPKDTLSRSFGMFVPYAIPTSVYPIVKWHRGLTSFGGSELAVAVKAWFAEIDILHSCGSFARHLFRRKPPYRANDNDAIHNIALTCRVCFTEKTWERYWWPTVFKKWLTEERYWTPDVLIQQHEFEAFKKRSDSEFWRGLMWEDVPDGVTD